MRVVHAARSGDDALVAQLTGSVIGATGANGVTVVTADRQLRERVRELGAETVGPGWLTARL